MTQGVIIYSYARADEALSQSPLTIHTIFSRIKVMQCFPQSCMPGYTIRIGIFSRANEIKSHSQNFKTFHKTQYKKAKTSQGHASLG